MDSDERHLAPLWRFCVFGAIYKCHYLLTYLYGNMHGLKTALLF